MQWLMSRSRGRQPRRHALRGRSLRQAPEACRGAGGLNRHWDRQIQRQAVLAQAPAFRSSRPAQEPSSARLSRPGAPRPRAAQRTEHLWASAMQRLSLHSGAVRPAVKSWFGALSPRACLPQPRMPPNLAFNRTRYGRPPLAAPGQAWSLSLRGQQRPAYACRLTRR
jgi:hypothetical protein